MVRFFGPPCIYVYGPFTCNLGPFMHYLLPRMGPGHPSSPLSIYFLIFSPFLLFSFFHWLYLFSYFVHPFPFYQNSPTPFPGRRL